MMKWHQIHHASSHSGVGQVVLPNPQVRTGSAAADCLEVCPLDSEYLQGQMHCRKPLDKLFQSITIITSEKASPF